VFNVDSLSSGFKEGEARVEDIRVDQLGDEIVDELCSDLLVDLLFKKVGVTILEDELNFDTDGKYDHRHEKCEEYTLS